MSKHWQAHPAVKTGKDLTFGERAADHMKAIFATWSALICIVLVMVVWMVSSGFGQDPKPFILLNLCLSCIAALQCFILLIAAKRADAIAAQQATHHLQLSEDIAKKVAEHMNQIDEILELLRSDRVA